MTARGFLGGGFLSGFGSFSEIGVTGNASVGGDATITGSLTVSGNTILNGTSITLGNGSGDSVSSAAGSIGVGSGTVIRWSSAADPTATKDTGISRNAAGVVEINNGTAGTRAALRVGTIDSNSYVSLSAVGHGLMLGSTTTQAWSSTTDPTATKDTGIARAAAGLAEVNNGTAGTLRDLTTRTTFANTSFSLGTVTWSKGTGTPEGVVTAPVGSMFSRTDGGASTTLYVKESGTGNTGWKAVVTA